MSMPTWASILIKNLAVLGLLLVLVEGALSFGLFVLSAESSVRRARFSWSHTIHDPELGWVSAPHVSVADMYGPGRHLRTNGRGFRENQEIDEDIPIGKRRVVCSGDSFTFGYGVGNDQTWCARLEAIAPHVDTVNLGQGGYGVDQAYLRYKRDASDLRHEVHLFAFITNGFGRMMLDSFHGYGKPQLKVDKGALTVSNVPVPRRPFYVPWLMAILPDLRHLRTLQAVGWAGRKLQPDRIGENRPSREVPTDESRELLRAILQQTASLGNQRASKLVLVHLPTPKDYSADETSRAWTEFLRKEAKALGVGFIDIVGQHRELSPLAAAALFGENKHLSVDGNEYVARVIHRSLRRTLTPRASRGRNFGQSEGRDGYRALRSMTSTGTGHCAPQWVHGEGPNILVAHAPTYVGPDAGCNAGEYRKGVWWSIARTAMNEHNARTYDCDARRSSLQRM
jgi:hypothetical protein